MDLNEKAKDLPQLITEAASEIISAEEVIPESLNSLSKLVSCHDGNIQRNSHVSIDNNNGNVIAPTIINNYMTETASAVVRPFEIVISRLPTYIRRERYNLIVVSQEAYDNSEKRDNDDIFSVSYDNIFSDKITNEAIARELRSLTDDAREKLLSYPTIVTAECKYKGYMAAPGQYAQYGYLTDIIRKDYTAEISFVSINDRIPLSLLEQNKSSLGISSRARCSELTDSRWEVKQINLIDTLRKMGMQINYPPD